MQARHYQLIWLLAQGKTTTEVMEVTGQSRSWIYELVERYNCSGPESMGDRRCHNKDRDPLLNDVQQAQLWQALQSPPPDGGLWNGRKVADWMSQLLGRKVNRQRGWEYLKSMGFRLRIPRPSHENSDINEQEEWKRNLNQEVQQIKEEHPDCDSVLPVLEPEARFLASVRSGQWMNTAWD